MKNNNNPLSARITQHYSKLTEGNRRLADYLQLNPDKVLILSTNDIAEACGVSKTSVSRFIRKLGYEDHLALRNELIAARDQGRPMLISPAEASEFQSELSSLEQLWSQLSDANLEPLLEKIARAKRIKIIGYRNSYPLAMHFRQQLMQCRGGVDLLPLPGQSIGEDLAAIEKEDFVIVIGIRRRVSHFSMLIDQLKDNECFLITDQSGQKYLDKVKHVLVCHMNNSRPLDSYSVPMSLIGYLVNQVYLKLGKEASSLSDDIIANYAALNEIE